MFYHEITRWPHASRAAGRYSSGRRDSLPLLCLCRKSSNPFDSAISLLERRLGQTHGARLLTTVRREGLRPDN